MARSPAVAKRSRPGTSRRKSADDAEIARLLASIQEKLDRLTEQSEQLLKPLDRQSGA